MMFDRVQSENPDVPVEDAFVVPAWFSQQKSWLEDPANSDSAVYNYPLLLRLRGPLNVNALERSMQEIVRRHEVLRSVFRMVDGELVQLVVPAQGAVMERMEWAGMPEDSRPFDLSRGPLLRARLMRREADDHYLHLTTHHLVFDDWSTGIFGRELSELYEAFAAGKESPLGELAYQYSDYVRWQQQQLEGKGLESRLAYWKQQATTATGFEHLATDFARPARSSNRGARESLVFPTELADSLKTLSRQERVSLFMVLLAGFQCLLHHYSNHDEIGIASCAANRPLVEVEGLIGRFGNHILLRASLPGNPTVRELLRRVRENALGAYSYQDLPYGDLVDDIAPGSDPSHSPLFQVMFILQNAPKQSREVPGMSMSWVPLYAGTAKFDLNVWLKIEPALEVILEYSTDVFRAATMTGILHDYQAILAAIANDPGMRVSDLPVSKKARPAKSPSPPASAPLSLLPKDNAGPKDDVRSRLVEIWEAAFAIRPIGVDQNFFELGGDSLLAARLFVQMEKAFQTKLPLAALLEAPTIEQLAGILSGQNAYALNSSLVVIQPNGTRPPLFSVHGHMGEVFYCRTLSRSLGADYPLYGLRYPVLNGEPTHYSVEDMAGHYVREIRTVQPKGPYFLGGYCSGGMVAYEMARLLKAQGEEVALLALFNTPAPGSLKGWPLRRNYLSKRIPNELKKLVALGSREMLLTLGTKMAGFSRLAFGSFKASFWRLCAKSSLAGAEKWSQRLLSVGDINVAAAKAYNPGAYPGEIILFLTEEAASLYMIDPKDGWMALAGEGIEVHSVPGDNNSMFDARFVDALAEKLKSCITRALANARESAVKPFITRFVDGPKPVPT
jgi:thioesterase domain-containing protein/acyl carrier protein